MDQYFFNGSQFSAKFNLLKPQGSKNVSAYVFQEAIKIYIMSDDAFLKMRNIEKHF